VLELRETRTAPPPLLTERELLSAMERHGIGTDATMATHIETILERNYARKLPPDRFEPTALGVALVMGFEKAGLDLHKPHLRAAMEAEMRRISAGARARGDVVAQGVVTMRGLFEQLRRAAPALDEVMQRHFRPVAGGAALADAPVVQRGLVVCGKCDGMMDVRAVGLEVCSPFIPLSLPLSHPRLQRAVACPRCGDTLPVPGKGTLAAHGARCPLCRYGVLAVTPEPKRGERQPQGRAYQVCPGCFTHAPPEVRCRGRSSRERETEWWWQFGGEPEQRFPCFQCSNSACPLAGRAVHNPISVCRRADRVCGLSGDRQHAVRGALSVLRQRPDHQTAG
jgi:DNA topoisomerase-3